MKPRSWILAILALIALAVGAGWLLVQKMMPPQATAAALDPEQGRLTDAFLDLLDRGAWEEALAMTTPKVQEALGEGKLQEVWESLPGQLGARKSRGAARGAAVEGKPIVSVPLEFGLLTLDAWVSFDEANLIQGFRLVPAASAAPAAVEFAESAAWSERAARVGDETRGLGATLTQPRGTGPFAAVVFVHGSGPQDRDASVGPNRIFRDLAHGLAERGIASLRYDKRTKVRPQDFAAGHFTVDDETVDDAVAALETLRAEASVDARRLFVVGHSQGAIMAPRIAQRVPDLAGIVLMASSSRPLQDVYLQQLEYLANLDGTLRDDERAQLEAERRKAAAVATLTPDAPARDNLMGLPGGYWVDLRSYDPVAVARTLPQRMLVLQGGRDYQVTPDDDFVGWQAAFSEDPRVTLRLYPALNHLFIAGEGTPRPVEYAEPGQVETAVIEDIARWIRGEHDGA